MSNTIISRGSAGRPFFLPGAGANPKRLHSLRLAQSNSLSLRT